MTQKDQALGYFQRPLPASSVHVTYRLPDLGLHQPLNASAFARHCRHRRYRRRPLLLFRSFQLQTMIGDNDCAPILDQSNQQEIVSASNC